MILFELDDSMTNLYIDNFGVHVQPQPREIVDVEFEDITDLDCEDSGEAAQK